MEHAKLANGSRHESTIGRSPSPAEQDQKDEARSAGKKALRKRTEPRKAKPARPVRKKMGSKPKSNKLVCRYCGSAPLIRQLQEGQFYFGDPRLRWVNIQPALTGAMATADQTRLEALLASVRLDSQRVGAMLGRSRARPSAAKSTA
jgi:hypothetical protein